MTVSPAGTPPEPPSDEEAATVVRGYSEGRHVFVKDTRTGQKTSDVDGVLQRGPFASGSHGPGSSSTW